MTNHLFAPIDYDAVLADLKGQREVLDTAIGAIERIKERNNSNSNGSRVSSRTPYNGIRREAASATAINLKAASTYDSAVALIEMEKKPLTTRELYTGMLAGGKIFTSGKPVESIAGTLYKAMREKPNCRLTRIEDAWALRDH
jgi:hypothetical protein